MVPRHPPCALNNLTLRQAHSAIFDRRPAPRADRRSAIRFVQSGILAQYSVVKVPRGRPGRPVAFKGCGVERCPVRTTHPRGVTDASRCDPYRARLVAGSLDRSRGISGRCLDSVRSGCSRGAGGAGGARTPDLRLAKAALSQLSYGPGLTRLVRPARQPRLPATAWRRGGGPSWTRTRDLSLIRTAL